MAKNKYETETEIEIEAIETETVVFNSVTADMLGLNSESTSVVSIIKKFMKMGFTDLNSLMKSVFEYTIVQAPITKKGKIVTKGKVKTFVRHYGKNLLETDESKRNGSDLEFYKKFQLGQNPKDGKFYLIPRE